jgi:protein-tyrosine-phosphatase
MSSGAILFVCTQNAVRSVIAEALFRQLKVAAHLNVMSCGVRVGAPDGFAMAVLDELGINVTEHEPRDFEGLSADDFTHIISFSSEARDFATDWSDGRIRHDYWPVEPPQISERNRAATLESYKLIRDKIATQLTQFFGSTA